MPALREQTKEEERVAFPLLFARCGSSTLEAQTEGDRDIAGLGAILREDVKSIQIRIPIGKTAGRIERVNIASFHEDPCRSEARELVGKSKTSIHTESVAGVVVDGCVALIHEAVTEYVAC